MGEGRPLKYMNRIGVDDARGRGRPRIRKLDGVKRVLSDEGKDFCSKKSEKLSYYSLQFFNS